MIIPELLKLYEDNVDDIFGLPIFDKFHWKNLCDKYLTDEGVMSKKSENMRDTLIEFFKIHKPKFPYRQFDLHESRKLFYDLRNNSGLDNIFPHEKCEPVHEKYDDYVGNWNDHGLGVINYSANYNEISDIFMNKERLKCSYFKTAAPSIVWESQENLKLILSPIWRLHPHSDDGLQTLHYMEGIRVGAYIATQFKPPVARAFYNITYSKKVLDTSCGWGDRLAGFFCSNAEEYYGMDPNGDIHKQYHDMSVQYNQWLGCDKPISEFGDNWFSVEGNKKVKIYRSPAEDLPWDEIPNDIDVMFSSPPYFATERYAEGSRFENDQSWSRYDSYEKWRDGFYLPVMEKSFEHLSPGGYLCVNIMDPKVKGNRYKACDDLINHFKEHFIGQIGMRIHSRPKGLKSFDGDTAEEKKRAYDEWMSKWFIESVWCFRKPGGREHDLFAPYHDTTLESFFAV